MKNFATALRLSVLALFATGILTGCKKADAPVFSPAPGTYTGTQYVAMSTPTFGATIVYTTDGSAPSCQKEHGTIYSAPVAIAANTTLRAMACALLRDESLITKGVYVIKARETVATPAFNPAAGTYVATQAVSISSATTDATIRYTSDGTQATCTSGTAYAGPIEVAQSVTLSAIGCATAKIDSAVASAAYVITPPAAAPVFAPAPGAYTSVQNITLTSATPDANFRYTTDGSDPSCATGASYSDPIAVSNSLTLKAVACANGYSDSLVTSGGYDIALPPEQSVWNSFDFNAAPNFAAGSHSTNETGDALNISARGKVESQQQVFHFVYANITGDFVMTARLDGVDFAGFTSNQGRTGLLLTPDIAPTGNAFVYGSSVLTAVTTAAPFARSDRLAAGSANANSNITVTGTGERYLKLTRTGNTYQAAVSLNGDVTANYVNAAVRTFTAGLPASVYVGFMISSSSNTVSASATFSDVHIRDLAGNVIVGPDEFTGEIGTGTPGGGGGGPTTPPTGPTHPDDQSRGATPAEPSLLPGSVANYNIEGFAAAAVTGGGNIPDTDARYRRVTTATELVAALRAARASNANPVRVIEIMNDLNMGWNEVGTDLQVDGLLRQNIAPKKHPALITSGVSLLDIMNFNGLTIFSRNGASIRHAEFNIKAGTNLILRNLKFDELWEWDEATRGDYDSNDWDFVTIGDGGGVTSGIWVDHCTFTKSYDGVLDIKRGASAITVSWSEVVPAATGPGSFVQRQFDDLETNRATNVMYNLLRGPASAPIFTQQQIIDIALPQKKGHLIGSNNLEGLTTYTVTLHHNHYQDLQDRMPRLRGGDVHGYNLYVDSSNARIVKEMRDGIVAANPTLAASLNSTYHFGITSNASISTEGGAVQIDNSVFFGVLTPFRNNQTDVTNPAYTGAIRGSNILHILLATDTQYMPVASQQNTFQDRGLTWASWYGNSDAALSTLGPTQAPQIPFVWHNGGPMYLMTLDPVADLPTLLTGPQGAGAGRIGMTTQQWLQVAN
jgi:pectate lyase